MTLTTAQWINELVSLFLPILTGLVTAKVASPGVKAVVLLILAAVSGFLVQWLDALNTSTGFDFSQAVFTAGAGFITAVALHFGLLKPASITGSTGAVNRLVPGGIGAQAGQE